MGVPVFNTWRAEGPEGVKQRDTLKVVKLYISC